MEYHSENNMEAGIMQGVIGLSQKKAWPQYTTIPQFPRYKVLGALQIFVASPVRSLDCSVLFVTEFVDPKFHWYEKASSLLSQRVPGVLESL